MPASCSAESPDMGPEERRLTDIIRSNSERVSTIINNVLQLSRREATKPTPLDARRLARGIPAPSSRETMQVPESRIGVREEADDLEVRFDPEPSASSGLEPVRQRDQVRRGARRQQGRDQVEPPEPELSTLSGGRRPRAGHRSGGLPIASSSPFLPGRKGGTGLGLFIARELCQLNRAILLYEPRSGGGSVFRIVFSDPQRWEE